MKIKSILTKKETENMFGESKGFFAQRYHVEGKNIVDAVFLISTKTLKSVKVDVKVNGVDASQMYYNEELCESLHNRLENM